jgi:alkanesulfonate monooxygenase SsuD/methylene tetrahydromethanopterin reductase-like flavin-dependent oxidoreductase (luciferase family)
MFKQHIDVYRKAWTDAGHPGEAPVYLRCPGFVAKTDAAAQEAYRPTLMQHFQNQNRLLSDSARRQNSPPDHPRFKTAQRLLEITFEEVLRGSVFIGSPDTVVGKLKDLQRDIGLSGVQLETNCAGLADHAAEREAIRLLAHEVKSAFR